MHVVFRADASADIGFGHVARCITLGAVLRGRGHAATVVTRSSESRVMARIERAGMQVVAIPPDASMAVDRQRTFEVAGRDAVLIVDHYGWKPADHRAAREAGLKTVAIDDLGDRALDADVVLNQNAFAGPDLYAPTSHMRMLLGGRYALLRPEFLARRVEPRPVPATAAQCLVTLGGGDAAAQTLDVLEGVAQSEHRGLQVTAVVGPLSPDREALTAWAARHEDRFRIVHDPECLADLMAANDMAIAAAGTTCWELACLGVPQLTVVMADNQQRNADELDRRGVSVHLGLWKDVEPSTIATAVDSLVDDRERRMAMSQAGQRLIDGRGAARVAEVIETL
jgi:UDP-2,4-diacetamido-2,4,6-trideoxy-beta-L-altropyranose hydrolase